MTTGLNLWSKTAASNGTADTSCYWPEGQAPSTINDSARAMMARISEWRDDIAATITTGGTSTAYTITSNQVFSSLSYQNMIAFIPHATNTGTTTLNVDGLGAKPLRAIKGVEITPGTLILGTPYVAYYNSSDAVWYLGGVPGTAMVPLGTILDFAGSTAPSTHFALAYGQEISRTTYSALFGVLGTTFGTGDGSSTFNLPDLRGRAVFGLDNMGGSAASRITTAASAIDGTTLGASGGAQTVTMAQSDMPNIDLKPTITASGTVNLPYNGAQGFTIGGSQVPYQTTSKVNSEATSVTVTATSSSIYLNGNTTQTAMKNMPPAIVLGKLIRVL